MAEIEAELSLATKYRDLTDDVLAAAVSGHELVPQIGSSLRPVLVFFRKRTLAHWVLSTDKVSFFLRRLLSLES